MFSFAFIMGFTLFSSGDPQLQDQRKLTLLVPPLTPLRSGFLILVESPVYQLVLIYTDCITFFVKSQLFFSAELKIHNFIRCRIEILVFSIR